MIITSIVENPEQQYSLSINAKIDFGLKSSQEVKQMLK